MKIFALIALALVAAAAPALADGPLNPRSPADQRLQKVGTTVDGVDVYMDLGEYGKTAVLDGSYVTSFWLVYPTPQHIPEGTYNQVMATTRVWCRDKTYATDFLPQYWTRDELVYAAPPEKGDLKTAPVQDGHISGLVYSKVCP